MAIQFNSLVHVFSINDITGTFSGLTFADDPSFIDVDETVRAAFIDKDGNSLYGMDSEFGFNVTDFIGAEQKTLDGDYAEGFAGNILNDADPSIVEGIALRNAPTDIFKSGSVLGTWSLGLGGQTVKASTEHYGTMAEVLSDQLFPGDPDAISPLDNDLKLRDERPTGVAGEFEPGVTHDLYVNELSEALQYAIDKLDAASETFTNIDFDRDGTADTWTTLAVETNFDADGDGIAETIKVAGVDLDADGNADIIDKALNGIGTEADITDLLDPNEASTTFDIAYSSDYSVTVKDDGKLLYRFGEAVKRPNDIRMEVNLELPEEWTEDLDGNGVADSLESGIAYTVTRAELVIKHDITNNPNDQVRPEDYENEAAIGRLPAHYIVTDPDDEDNTLWVSPVDSFTGSGKALPSYFLLNEAGEVDLAPAVADNPVYDPDGRLVGYRNIDAEGNLIGTVLKDLSLIGKAEAADLTFSSEDLEEGFTTAWFTTVDREPFEWSYDTASDDPYINVYESFRSPVEAAAAGFTEDDLASGPRWRLTPNKFGQDLPGLEVPVEENSQPPYQRDNIKYPTGEFTTTTLNLLDWEGDSPLDTSIGWMLVDPDRLDENKDGLIDEGWTDVHTLGGTTLQADDAMPTDLILSAVTPNGLNLEQNFLDTAVYVKGDRQDAAKLYDIQLIIEYEGDPVANDVFGTVQKVADLTHLEQSVSYQGGAVFDKPVVFATPPSLNGAHVATVGVSGVSASGAKLFIEEADYLDGTHKPEDVNLLTLEEGNWTLDDGTRLEVGTAQFAAGPTDVFQSVSFTNAFDEAPIILVQLQTDNGSEWDVVRIDNVTTDGFDFLLEEQEASDGWHTDEIVGWAAIDTASADGLAEWGDVSGQAFDVADAVDENGFVFDFDAALGSDPLISANISSYNGGDTAVLRLVDVAGGPSGASAEFLLQEDQSADSEVSHFLEDLSGIAFSGEGQLFGADAFMLA